MNLEDLYQNDFIDLESDDPFVGEVDITSEETGIEIPAFDYNLNSPLIRDEVEDLLLVLQKKIISGRFSHKWNFNQSLLWFKSLEIDWGHVCSTYHFHEWVFLIRQQLTLPVKDVIKQYHWIIQSLTGPSLICNAFLRGLIGETINLTISTVGKTGWIQDELMRDTVQNLAWFQFLHLIILIMNSVSAASRKNLTEEYKEYIFKGLEDPRGANSFLYSVRFPMIGDILVTTGYCFWVHHKRLIDRNMILMMKDLYAARACSCLSIYKTEYYGNWPNVINQLNKFYSLGDEIMAAVGNDGYDLIKYVEGCCNLQFMLLGQAYRPLIEVDNSFKCHIINSRQEFDRKHNVSSAEFFDHILCQTDPKIVAVFFGSFRHWGHPFLDYLEGLESLHTEVTKEKIIDSEYVQNLASDLAYKVLNHEFHKKKKWYVNAKLISKQHMFYDHIINQTWPNLKQIIDFGPNWHKLPIIPCFEIPIGIDPSILFADKSHSMNRTDVIESIKNYPMQPIKSLKVLQTALKTDHVNIREFLQSIDQHGLEENDLIIGLKGKEREVKRTGRFFSLMSWNLRLYFVITEYLIKKYYVPLFSGLTMADDYNSVIKKLLDRTSGQGCVDYEQITFANHFDYSKWNNTQRGEANNPIFRVMGQFFGMPHLFERTHEFFEKSWIYYNDRADLIEFDGYRLKNRTNHVVTWEGQKGGLEGLRQKGWSVVSLLVIERESKIRNTLVKVLAQGDNQVICTYYKIPKSSSFTAAQGEIPHVFENNRVIVDAIVAGTSRLGLQINRDETLTSAEILNYGKVILFRGHMLPLSTKRWSRITCTTNDQVPSLQNIYASVATNALTVTQHSPTILEGIVNYCFFGAFCLWHLIRYNPLLGHGFSSLESLTPQTESFQKFVVNLMFLDPSLGGLCGTSLTRFLIRQFPDPVTESLTFWKMIYNNTHDEKIKQVCIQNGYPEISDLSEYSFSKLLENPVGLNILRSTNPTSILREEVRNQLVRTVDTIRNQLFQEAICYLRDEEESLLQFLQTIRPVFPRFLSEFKSSTFLGITESIVGLFQNSRTIRMVFKKKFATIVSDLLRKGEESGILRVQKKSNGPIISMWECSAQHADMLRNVSWGCDVIGTTIPHPMELLGWTCNYEGFCDMSTLTHLNHPYISVVYPHGFKFTISERSPLPPYLGSKTNESTSIFQPWEKEIEAPLLQKSVRLRNAIQWFVPQNSALSRSIINNLRALTNLDWNEAEISFERTGSALHRFYCSRQSAGGYASVNPSLIGHVFVTSDTLGAINSDNYDFMYQSLLLYAQLASTTKNYYSKSCVNHHLHIYCPLCIRRINEIQLTSQVEYHPRSSAQSILKMSGIELKIVQAFPQLPIKQGNWKKLSWSEQSFHIGISQGTLFSLLLINNEVKLLDQSLFPETITKSVDQINYLLGILKGLSLGGCVLGSYHRDVYDNKRPIRTIQGSFEYILDQLLLSPNFLPSVSRWEFNDICVGIPHRLPASYPQSKKDLGMIVRAFMYYHNGNRTLSLYQYKKWGKKMWIFADFRTTKWVGLIICAHNLRFLNRSHALNRKQTDRLRMIKELISYFLDENKISGSGKNIPPITLIKMKRLSRTVLGCPLEMRMATKYFGEKTSISLPFNGKSLPELGESKWGIEYIFPFQFISLDFDDKELDTNEIPETWKRSDPLIAGLRIAQLSTGAHYKIKGLIYGLTGRKDCLCVGDGSGGISACYLRLSPVNRLIFNSLMDLEDRSFMGVRPAPPAAINGMPNHVKERCVNLMSCWEEPSNLCEEDTWDGFLKLKRKHLLTLNIFIMDAELKSTQDFATILQNLMRYQESLFEPRCFIIIKCYFSWFKDSTYTKIITQLCQCYMDIGAYLSAAMSSFTSEFYLVCRNRIKTPILTSNISLSSIKRLGTIIYSHQSEESEFNRALKFKSYPLLQGIPHNLIPPIHDELFNLFEWFGLETGVSREITSHVESEINSRNILAYCWMLLCLTSNAIINTTSGYFQFPKLPSLEQLQKHYALCLGIWEYIAWIVEDSALYMHILWWIDNVITYGFNIHVINNKQFIQWKWGKGNVTKKLHKPSKLSASSQIIRLLSRLVTQKLPTRLILISLHKAIDEIRASYNQRLTYQNLINYTGLIAIVSLPKHLRSNSPQLMPVVSDSDSESIKDSGLIQGLKEFTDLSTETVFY